MGCTGYVRPPGKPQHIWWWQVPWKQNGGSRGTMHSLLRILPHHDEICLTTPQPILSLRQLMMTICDVVHSTYRSLSRPPLRCIAKYTKSAHAHWVVAGLFRRFEDGSYQSLQQSYHRSYKKSLPWDGPWKWFTPAMEVIHSRQKGHVSWQFAGAGMIVPVSWKGLWLVNENHFVTTSPFRNSSHLPTTQCACANFVDFATQSNGGREKHLLGLHATMHNTPSCRLHYATPLTYVR
jgi:hypothetical protein